ncbi:MAG TPA: nucleoside 2-deoxyribosyltransferase, partial [Methanomicrobiales archaeon]|nr:nucleoside 2-deoxyribosyltransferase [Methanomicrobiales archaeon]
YVLACPCILDPSLRARGITSDADRSAFTRALERCRRFGIEVVPLPCPETLYLGRDREPITFLSALDTPEFSNLLDCLERDVREIIKRRGPPLCILGVDSSPSCGVNFTYVGSRSGEPPKQKGRGALLARFPDVPAADVVEFSRYRVYLAAPLFSEAERRYNLLLRENLERGLFSVFLPQEEGDGSTCRDSGDLRAIYEANVGEIRKADIVVAVCEGADAESGTSWEMGFAFALGKPVYALRSDFRMVGTCERVNLMLEESATFVRSIEELLRAMKSPLFFEGLEIT